MTIKEWAKDFKSYVDELNMPRDDYKGIMIYIDEALALSKEQPEIVCCRDCKYSSIYMTEDVCGKTLIECNHPELGDNIAIHAWDWFCADGKRRDDDG